MGEAFGPYKAHEVAEWFPMLGESELRELSESIKRDGQIEACVVWGTVLVDGRNRWRACELAGVEPRVVRREFESEEQVGRWVLASNVARRHLTVSQKVAFGERLREREEKAARERQIAARERRWESERAEQKLVWEHVPTPSSPPAPELAASQPAPPLPEPPRIALPAREAKRARDEAGKAAGVSGRMLDQMRAVRREAVPEVVKAVEDGRLAVSAAVTLTKLPEEKQREIVRTATTKTNAETPEVRGGLVRQLAKQAVKQETARKIEAEPPPMPTGPFRVIVSDPPWAYEKRAGDASHRIDLPYPSMTTEEICALDVKSLAHDEGCVLWLWTTNAFMRDAYRVLDAWGFQEKTILTWVKDRMGMGDWLRGKTEHCILAIRGKPTVLLTNQTTALDGPLREHSRKPDEFYALVEALCPGSKVEMFCRTPRPGWAKWGAETEKFDAVG